MLDKAAKHAIGTDASYLTGKVLPTPRGSPGVKRAAGSEP